MATHAEESGREYSVVPLGKKCHEHYSRAGVQMVSDAFEYAQEIGVGECFDIGELITAGFLNGEYDRVFVCYNKFVSMMAQEPRIDQILPLAVDHDESLARYQIIYEPGEEEILDVIVPRFVSGLIYGAVCESLAAEQAARRMAMSSASDNAQEIKDDLTLEYNRARQAVITQEITEIVAGAEDR